MRSNKQRSRELLVEWRAIDLYGRTLSPCPGKTSIGGGEELHLYFKNTRTTKVLVPKELDLDLDKTARVNQQKVILNWTDISF